MIKLEFYKDNLALFLKMSYYKSKIFLLMFIILPILAIVAINLNLIPESLQPHKFELTLAFAAPLLLTFLWLLWKVLVVTGYSMGKGAGDMMAYQKHEIHIHGGFFYIAKGLLLLFLVFVAVVAVAYVLLLNR